MANDTIHTAIKCPVCDGSGLVSRPPHIAGDQREWSSSSSGPWPCKSCGGSGILWAVMQNKAQPFPDLFAVGDEVKMEPNESPRGFVNEPTNVYVAADGKGVIGSGTKKDPFGNIKYAIDFIRGHDPNGLKFWFISHKISEDDPALDFTCYRTVPGDMPNESKGEVKHG